ncbi:MAG: hypothetical protein N2067_05585 [Spirochaetaceae bacterium]|nr:hypothetical protein [Spirochaetaceae bacterium]
MKLELLGKPEGCKLLRVTIEAAPPHSDTSGAEPPLSPVWRVTHIQIRGDFFAIPEEAFDEIEQRLASAALTELGQRFDSLVQELGLECAGITGTGLQSLTDEALARLTAAIKE